MKENFFHSKLLLAVTVTRRMFHLSTDHIVVQLQMRERMEEKEGKECVEATNTEKERMKTVSPSQRVENIYFRLVNVKLRAPSCRCSPFSFSLL